MSIFNGLKYLGPRENDMTTVFSSNEQTPLIDTLEVANQVCFKDTIRH